MGNSSTQSSVSTAAALRERSFWACSSVSKAARSTPTPCSRAISSVRSIGKPIRLVEFESVLARNQLPALALGLFDHAVQQVDARGQRTQERSLLLLDHLFDQRLLGLQFGELPLPSAPPVRNELADRRLRKAEVGIAVTHGAAQDAADDVAGLDVATAAGRRRSRKAMARRWSAMTRIGHVDTWRRRRKLLPDSCEMRLDR